MLQTILDWIGGEGRKINAVDYFPNYESKIKIVLTAKKKKKKRIKSIYAEKGEKRISGLACPNTKATPRCERLSIVDIIDLSPHTTPTKKKKKTN